MFGAQAEDRMCIRIQGGVLKIGVASLSVQVSCNLGVLCSSIVHIPICRVGRVP